LAYLLKVLVLVLVLVLLGLFASYGSLSPLGLFE
jgi:hypothetical protein